MSRRRLHAWRAWLPGFGLTKWHTWCGREQDRDQPHAFPTHESDCQRCLDSLEAHHAWKVASHARALELAREAARALELAREAAGVLRRRRARQRTRASS